MINNTTPVVRFPGFTGEWIQVRLGEISEHLEYGLNASATKYDGENKYIRITDIDDKTNKFLNENLTSPNKDLLSAENYLLEEGDILFARTGASVGKSYIYDKRDGKMYYAGFLIRARIKSTYNPEFIFQNTLTSKYEKFIKITSQRSGQPGVNAKEYSSFLIMTPNINEQIKIGNFFKQLDKMITLQEQELENLKQTKRGFLQKMFPKEGESAPEIRFPGFTEDWKQNKLGEVIKTYPAQKYIATPVEKGKYEVIRQGDQAISGYSNEVPFEDYHLVTLFGDHTLSLYKPKCPFLVATDGIKILSIPSFDSYFFFSFLEKYSPRSQGYKRHFSILKNTYVSYSTNLKEQKKIGQLFKHIDKKITLQQQELESLQETKKAFLQKMFV